MGDLSFCRTSNIAKPHKSYSLRGRIKAQTFRVSGNFVFPIKPTNISNVNINYGTRGKYTEQILSYDVGIYITLHYTHYIINIIDK